MEMSLLASSVTLHAKEKKHLDDQVFYKSGITKTLKTAHRIILTLNLLNCRVCQHQFLLGGGNPGK